MLGTTLTDEELLAVAQHYGFPTPLLDFTRSLRIAAFFATRDTRRGKVNGVGVIHCFQLGEVGLSRQTVAKLATLGLGDFQLLPAVGIRVGSWRLIEPRIPDPENRIAHQQGLFIADCNVRDLHQTGAGAVFFHQHENDVYEDAAVGITEDTLLEARTSRVNQLADRTRQRFKDGWAPARGRARRRPRQRGGRAQTLNPVLARVALPG